MRDVLWAPKFAAVYFLAALALFVMFTVIGSNIAIVAPWILTLFGLGVAVLMRSRTARE